MWEHEEEKDEAWVASRQAIAGALAGASTALLLHPLDTVKTFRQSNPAMYNGMLPTLRTIIVSKGPKALYSGMIPALVGSTPSSAVYFTTYEFMRRRLNGMTNRSSGSPLLPRAVVNMLSAASGNLMSSVIFVPKEVLKQRLQVGLGGSLRQAASLLYREKGMRGFYSGYFATLMRNIPSTALKFMFYEEIKFAFRLFSQQDELSLTPLQHLTAGGLAGICSSCLTTPMDVMKTKYAMGQGSGLNAIQLGRNIVQEQGLLGLFVGLRPRLLWATLFSAIGFTTYETFKRMLIGDYGDRRIPIVASSRKSASGHTCRTALRPGRSHRLRPHRIAVA